MDIFAFLTVTDRSLTSNSTTMPFLNISWKNPVVLILCFLLIVSVRFNRNDLLVKRNLGDAAFYIGNVEYLRGDQISYGLRAPFNERLLVTVFAAPLPFDPMTSINVVNVIFLLLSIFYLFKLLELFDLDPFLIWLGVYMFVVSFPTFYYSTIGYIDSGVMLSIFAGCFAIYSNKYWLFLVSIVLGTLAKEGIILLIPVAVAYAYAYDNKKWYAYALMGLVIYFLVWGAVKYYIPNSRGNTPILFWQPIYWRIRDNFTRLNAYLSSILSFGVPGALLILSFIRWSRKLRQEWKQDLPLWVGTISGYLLWFYTLFSAHTDGRFFWVAYCFPIALVLIWWNRYGNPLTKTNDL